MRDVLQSMSGAAGVMRAVYAGFRRVSPVLAILAMCEAGYVIHVNRSLAARYDALRAFQSGQMRVSVGELITGVAGADADGRRVILDLRNGPRSFVVGLSAGCPACQSSLVRFRRLAELASSRGMRVVYVTRDPVSLASASVMAPSQGITIFEPDYRTYVAVKLAFVPQALILSGEGRVDIVETGQLDEKKEARLAAAMLK